MLYNTQNFIVNEHPEFNPISQHYERMAYWKGIKRKCIEGEWLSGKWMPGTLYTFTNVWHIKMSSKKSLGKVLGRPYIRDLEWEKHLNFCEARGFSGFSEDSEWTCLRFDQAVRDFGSEELLKIGIPEAFTDKGERKKFMAAREYLRKIQPRNLGKPQFKNSAMNVIDLESRDCFGKDTEVVMFDGSIKLVQNIVKGDVVMGPDGESRNVQWTHSGIDDLYKIKPTKNNADDFVVNSNHKLQVLHYTGSNKKGYSFKPRHFKTSDVFDKKDNSGFKNTYKLYQSKAIEFTEKELPIDPYYLGLWLADGRSNSTSINITDEKLWEFLEMFAEENDIQYTIRERQGKENWKVCREYYYKDDNFRKRFNDNNLLNNKHIPEIYMKSSIAQRTAMLEGLIDGDGWYDGKCRNHCIATGPRKDLAMVILRLIRSLGFAASVKEKFQKPLATKIQYIITISGDNHILKPLCKRKNAPKIERRLNVNSTSFDMEYLGKGEFFGFKLDGDHLFVKSDYIVQHNTGKSYNAAVWIAHNWMFDGATDYDDYMEMKKAKTPLASETLVGAIEAKYSMELLDKAMLGYENIPGSVEYQGKHYPSPLWKDYDGSFNNKAQTIKIKSSKSKILHRTFEKDPLAAAGSRPSFVALEEVGFMNNIEEVLGGLEDAVSDDGRQYGTIYMFGTGGFVKGNSVTHLQKIFYNPEDYNCLAFDDIWEPREKKIGYFVPSSMAVNKFKEGPNMETNFTMAEAYWKSRREEMKQSSKEKFFSFIINRPLVPSEIFLVSEGGMFPAAELKDVLSYLETSKELDMNFVGKLVFNDVETLDFVTDLELSPIRDYPLQKNSLNRKGAIEIFEKPQLINGIVPSGTYLLGADTIDKAISTTDSLGSVFVFNRFTRRIVAEYTGRSDNQNDFYEICRRLCIYYTGTLMYEKNLPGLYTYFDNKRQDYLLADTPPHLRSINTFKVGTNTAKGINASGTVNETGLQYIKSWMLELKAVNKEDLMLTTIKSPALLRECILYNPDGNFDRVSALSMVMWHDQTTYRSMEAQEVSKESFVSNDYWKKQGMFK